MLYKQGMATCLKYFEHICFIRTYQLWSHPAVRRLPTTSYPLPVGRLCPSTASLAMPHGHVNCWHFCYTSGPHLSMSGIKIVLHMIYIYRWWGWSSSPFLVFHWIAELRHFWNKKPCTIPIHLNLANMPAAACTHMFILSGDCAAKWLW